MIWMPCEQCRGVHYTEDMIRYHGLLFCTCKCAKKWAVAHDERERRARLMAVLFGNRKGEIIV